MKIYFINIGNIFPDKQQSRKIFDTKSIEELSESIRHGSLTL